MEPIHRERLLNVAKALRESPKPEAFDMGFFGHGDDMRHTCGTPACALGHYAFREDLQAVLSLGKKSGALLRRGDSEECALDYDGKLIRDHFGIDGEEAAELFASPRDYGDDDEALGAGCGNAKTAIQAAEYIERFVQERS